MDRSRISTAVGIICATVAPLIISSCRQQPTSSDGGLDVTSRFIPQAGMRLQSIAEVPGVTWFFDTIAGVCVSDTLVLWATYEGVDYITNVVGTANSITNLEKSGFKKVRDAVHDFSKADFSHSALVLSNGLDLSHETFRQGEDSIFKRKTDAVKAMISEFFMSGGDSKYMAEPMATNWRLIRAQAQNGDGDPANPFNTGPEAVFRDESVKVEIVDPCNGIAEVTAYCMDPYTLGAPGWAYWTVIFCKRNGIYLIKETPIYHNRFVVG